MDHTGVTPRIVFGCETEYGIFLSNRSVSRRYDEPSVAFETIAHMLEAAVTLFPKAFSGIRGGIKSEAEHEAIERETFLRRGNKKELDLPPIERKRSEALFQRRGFTGLMLPNGARFYQDMLHPEFSIPEVDSPYDALICQKAGDRIVELCRAYAEDKMCEFVGKEDFCVRIDKNNSDYRDGRSSSYAGHENYALTSQIFERICSRDLLSKNIFRKRKFKEIDFLPVDPLADIVMLFFVARQIITGAGKVGSHLEAAVPYQISQRADFIEHRMSVDTTVNRGIINLRDEPYTDISTVSRFHVIVGDSNVSDLSIYLKHGITALFFMMLNDGFLEREGGILTTPLAEPVHALHAVSYDLSLREKLAFANGQKFSALEVMREFSSCASRFVGCKKLSQVWHDVVARLNATLDGLESGRHKHELSRSLDWVAKERFLHSYQKKTGEGPLSDNCVFLELEYHNVNRRESIFEKLQKSGEIITLARESDINTAIHEAPLYTRAWLRSEVLKRYGNCIRFMNWKSIFADERVFLGFPDPYFGGKNDAAHLFSGDPSWEEFLKRVSCMNPSKIIVKIGEEIDDALIKKPNRRKK